MSSTHGVRHAHFSNPPVIVQHEKSYRAAGRSRSQPYPPSNSTFTSAEPPAASSNGDGMDNSFGTWRPSPSESQGERLPRRDRRQAQFASGRVLRHVDIRATRTRRRMLRAWTKAWEGLEKEVCKPVPLEKVERGVAMWEFDVEDLHGIERTMCFYRIFMGALLQDALENLCTRMTECFEFCDAPFWLPCENTQPSLSNDNHEHQREKAILENEHDLEFLAHKTLRWEYEDGQLAQLQKDIELETGHVVCLDGQVYTEGGPKDFFDWNVHPTTTLEVCFYAWRLVVRLLSQQHLARSMLKLHMKHDRNAGAPNTNTTRVAHVKSKLERAGLFENPRDSPFWSYGSVIGDLNQGEEESKPCEFSAIAISALRPRTTAIGSKTLLGSVFTRDQMKEFKVPNANDPPPEKPSDQINEARPRSAPRGPKRGPASEQVFSGMLPARISEGEASLGTKQNIDSEKESATSAPESAKASPEQPTRNAVVEWQQKNKESGHDLVPETTSQVLAVENAPTIQSTRPAVMWERPTMPGAKHIQSAPQPNERLRYGCEEALTQRVWQYKAARYGTMASHRFHQTTPCFAAAANPPRAYSAAPPSTLSPSVKRGAGRSHTARARTKTPYEQRPAIDEATASGIHFFSWYG